MVYVYMDNFRGFSSTLIPISKNTFLVGENSTGKSSFLKLLQLLSDARFWLYPETFIIRESELGGFQDIVSAWSKNKRKFSVGLIKFYKNTTSETWSIYFDLFTFGNRDGNPHVIYYSQLHDGNLVELIPEKSRLLYRISKQSATYSSENEAINSFVAAIDIYTDRSGSYKAVAKKKLPPLPLQLQIEFLKSSKGETESDTFDILTEPPAGRNFTWIAPIRTKSHRFYDGLTKGYSPEGEHTPYLLRRSLKLKSRSSIFAAKLKEFGNSSGLFSTITTHSFEAGPQSPFEIIVHFHGVKLNLNNVGYGVSQALPLVTEFLSSDTKRGFIVQQPEVHLHPRAQAALGDLIYHLAQDGKHLFFIETHSDYLIDRFRLQMHKMNNDKKEIKSQILFFERTENGNRAYILPLSVDGKYPNEQPACFRDFFLKEEMSLLEI
jgi:AAA domain, putative AbiEii toxin, Type IV TA system